MIRDQRPSPPRPLGWLRRLAGDRRGATAVEYGLIVALIVIAMLAGFIAMADKTTAMWNHVSTEVVNAG